MFIQNKGIVTMTVELLDTEEAQADDPLDVQVKTVFHTYRYTFKDDIVAIALQTL